MAVAVVVDVALSARGQPVAARALAERQGRPRRHLEAMLQSLVRHGLLKGTRGPLGGYELARERRRITVGDILRAIDGDAEAKATMRSQGSLVVDVVVPTLAKADKAYLTSLDAITLQDLTDAADRTGPARDGGTASVFHI